jgi:hypothetical protein
VPQTCESVSLCVCVCVCARIAHLRCPRSPPRHSAPARLTGCVRSCAGAGKALQLAGDSVKAHYLLANAQLHLEQLEEAEASFQVARL